MSRSSRCLSRLPAACRGVLDPTHHPDARQPVRRLGERVFRSQSGLPPSCGTEPGLSPFSGKADQ